MRLVQIDTASGNVVAEWQGDDARPPVAPVGRTFIDVASHGDGPFSGRRWDGAAFVAVPCCVIAFALFLQRMTSGEAQSFEDFVMTRPRLRAWLRLVQLTHALDLDAAETVSVLAFMKAQGFWPDAPTADARIAALRVDG